MAHFDDPKSPLPVMQLTPAVPPDPSISVWSRFISTFEAAEYSGWSDESICAKTDCWIGDWSPLAKLRIKGPEALEFLHYISTNYWPNIRIGQAKHVINCYDDGSIIGEGLVLCVDKDDYIYTGGPGCFWAMFLHANPRTKAYNVELEDLTQNMFLLQVQGPKSVPLLDEMTQEYGGVRDINFMNAKKLAIEGHECWCLRQGISGELGYELWGRMSDATKVYQAVLRHGQKHNIRQLGGRAKLVHHVEAGFASPTYDYVPLAHGDGEELAKYREYLGSIGINLDGFLTKYAGSYAKTCKDLHATPFDLGWEKIVNTDHDFIGRDALAKIKDNQPNKLMTLIWNDEDVAEVFASLFRNPSYQYMELPRNIGAGVIASTVLIDDEVIGYTTSRSYSTWHKQMLSLGVIKAKEAIPGVNVMVTWGEEGKPQKKIRAILQPAPYKEDRRRHSTAKMKTRS